jgi:predicted ATP-dependent endonuclease of OLD family
MKISKIQLKDFKRFDDLTIDLGDSPRKIIALVGPNGCGKSSIFDAFEEKMKDYKSANSVELPAFFSKLWHSISDEIRTENYSKGNSIKIWSEGGGTEFTKKSFIIRTAYRFTPKILVNNINSLEDILEDRARPTSSISIDIRLKENYERLMGKLISEFQHGDKTGSEIREILIGKVNMILGSILDIQISDLGDVTVGRGQLYFSKETSKDFPFENLSSGEKEVVDIIIDLLIRIPEYNDTVYCIDEPELHLNTAIQRKLIIEIEKLLPDTCQLWVATHSIGFLRALQEELKDKSQILDFSEKDYFNGEQTIHPMKATRRNWQRIFQTALEDLTGLIAPKKIYYCEGRTEPTTTGVEQGMDAQIYNQIFEEEYSDTLFVSSGGNTEPLINSSVAIKVLSKAFSGVELYLLKDKDNKTDQDRLTFLGESTSNRMLLRREIENYIFDSEVIKKCCVANGKAFDESNYNKLVFDIQNQDLKPNQQAIQQLCGTAGSVGEFKIKLASFISPEMNVYKEIKACVV